MVNFIIRRILYLIPVLIAVSIIVFGVVRLAPGDPALIIVGGKQTTPEILESIRTKYNLNEPIWKQYVLWLKGVLSGDLGESYKMKQSVTSMIKDRIPVTFKLVFMSMIMTLVMSIPLGIIAAVKRKTWADYTSSLFVLVGVSSPVFFTGIIMVIIFSFHLNWFPAFGSGDGVDGAIKHLFLPSLALAFNMIALSSRITRAGMIDVLNSNYIQTAEAKGLPPLTIVIKHGLRNALIPLLTVTSMQIGILIVGTVLIEYTFGLGGLGSLIVKSVETNDYPLVQGMTLFMVLVFMLLNLLADVLYSIIDPRIRY